MVPSPGAGLKPKLFTEWLGTPLTFSPLLHQWAYLVRYCRHVVIIAHSETAEATQARGPVEMSHCRLPKEHDEK